MQNHFNYWILDPRKPGKYHFEGLNFCFLFEPFYTGTSNSKRRFKRHLWEASSNAPSNPHKSNKIKKIITELGIEPYFVITVNNISHEESRKIEISYIEKVGRYDLRLGPLTNLTNGGDGSYGIIMSEETKIKIGSKSKGRKPHPNTIEAITKRNLTSNYMKGRTGVSHHRFGVEHTLTSKEKIKSNHAKCDGKNNSRAKIYLFVNGDKSQLIEGEFEKFCSDNNLPISIMYRIYRNKRKNLIYKGWTVKEVKR